MGLAQGAQRAAAHPAAAVHPHDRQLRRRQQLRQRLQAHLGARQVEDLPKAQDLRTRLHEALRKALVGGSPSLDEVASSLGMSARSLQRRLSESGTTFRTEIDAVRNHTAQLLLQDPKLALSEVAWLLGFSDPRAFTRAFRRWHGVTPSAFRGGFHNLPARR